MLTMEINAPAAALVNGIEMSFNWLDISSQNLLFGPSNMLCMNIEK